MKAKKAIRRLDNVETSLSEVIDRFESADSNVRESLESVKETIVRVRAKVSKQDKPESQDKTSAIKRKGVRAESARAGASKTGKKGQKIGELSHHAKSRP